MVNHLADIYSTKRELNKHMFFCDFLFSLCECEFDKYKYDRIIIPNLFFLLIRVIFNPENSNRSTLGKPKTEGSTLSPKLWVYQFQRTYFHFPFINNPDRFMSRISDKRSWLPGRPKTLPKEAEKYVYLIANSIYIKSLSWSPNKASSI